MHKTKLVTISVTAKHIKNGKQHSFAYCPVALACKDVVAWGVELGVISKQLCLFSFPSIRFPVRVTQRIQRYDRKDDMQPFNFRIKLPLSVLRTADKRTSKGLRK